MDAGPDPLETGFWSTALRWTSRLLVGITWFSAAIFGAYILAFYGGAVVDDRLPRWNTTLPGLYGPSTRTATAGMAVHFLGGGILLLLGPLQLITPVRDRYPAAHRWVGRLFIAAALLAAVGGLTFIVLKGTIGGAVMDVGFGGYGLLMLLAAVQTLRHARARRFDLHRAWAIRLYALVIGSWLYRIDYGVWVVLTDAVGHTDQFDGWFDHVMAFAFYLPNLVVAELYLRAKPESPSAALQITATLALAAASTILIVGTYFFTRHYWGPEILARF